MAGHSTHIPMRFGPMRFGPMRFGKNPALSGTAQIPGDKSVSHRALLLGAMAIGETHIKGLLEGEDVLDTVKAMRAFGAHVTRIREGEWSVKGVGVGGFQEPETVINCGNSGTGVRLIMGAVGTHPFAVTFTGDASLCKRPMGRVLEPLALFGTHSVGRSGGRLPLTLMGAKEPVPITYTPPVTSAQVKSAVLLAGLNAPGETTVIEHKATRDHTERMLKGFGADIRSEPLEDGGTRITLQGHPVLNPCHINVPRDPSSAAFPICAALITEGSDITVPNIGLNPTRAGIYETLLEMGANITFENKHEEGGELVADIRARASTLKGIDVPPERAPSMIDEYPILAVAAAYAEGTTTMRGIAELRVKECDRIDAMVRGLRTAGVEIEETENSMTVHGRGLGGVEGGATAETFLDHRIAMSFLVLGLGAKEGMAVDNAAPIATSFPDFITLMEQLGAQIHST